MLALLGGIARADPAAISDGAVHAKRAAALAQRGQYREAIAEYESAYDRTRDPRWFIELGRCFRKLGEYDQAAYFFHGYIAFRPEAADRPEVEQLASEAETSGTAAAAVTRTLAASPPVYKRGWFWAVLGGVAAVGAGTAALVVLKPWQNVELPSDSLGTIVVGR